MRLSLLIATAISGIVVALGVFALVSRPDDPKPPSEPPRTSTGRPPAFHLDVTPAERRSILESIFPRIASERADRLGALKDDLALLIDGPESAAWIVAQWELHKKEGKYAEGAFGDLFRLVKRPEFVEPTAALLDSALPEIRAKAVQSAQTQASPALSGRILTAFRSFGTKSSSMAGIAKIDALLAGASCKGDAWPALLDLAIGDSNPDVAVKAMNDATDFDVPGVEAHAKKLIAESPERRVRLHAAALLRKRGDLSATQEILDALDPADKGVAAEALNIVAKHKIAAAIPRLRELRPKAVGELKQLYTLALLCAGDQDTLAEVLQTADVDGGPGELDALQMLAASGDVNVTPVLLHALGRGGTQRVHPVALGITMSGQAGFFPVVEKLIEFPVHPAELELAPKIAGPALIPKLARLLHEATDPADQIRLLALLAQVGGPEARNVILAERGRVGRLAEEQLRLIDLEARRLGESAPSLVLR